MFSVQDIKLCNFFSLHTQSMKSIAVSSFRSMLSNLFKGSNFLSENVKFCVRNSTSYGHMPDVCTCFFSGTFYFQLFLRAACHPQHFLFISFFGVCVSSGLLQFHVLVLCAEGRSKHSEAKVCSMEFVTGKPYTYIGFVYL